MLRCSVRRVGGSRCLLEAAAGWTSGEIRGGPQRREKRGAEEGLGTRVFKASQLIPGRVSPSLLCVQEMRKTGQIFCCETGGKLRRTPRPGSVFAAGK